MTHLLEYGIDPGCISLFTVVFPKDNVIYKGFTHDKTVFDHNSKDPCWFAFEENKARKYGEYVHQYKTTKPLKLLNISSIIFKQHFIDQINMSSIGDDDKEKILLTLGIPNIHVQTDIVKKNLSSKENKCATSKDLQTKIDYYNGYSRYSGTNLDSMMVAKLIAIYGKHVDGYIQPRDVPSCWHGNFPAEMCIFNISKHTLTRIKNSVKGGSNKKEYLEPRELAHEEYVRMACSILKRAKYPNDVIEKFRKSGAQKWPKLFVPKDPIHDDKDSILRMPDDWAKKW